MWINSSKRLRRWRMKGVLWPRASVRVTRVRGEPAALLARRVVLEKMEAPAQKEPRVRAGSVDFQVGKEQRESRDTKERRE